MELVMKQFGRKKFFPILGHGYPQDGNYISIKIGNAD
jgi:hypothetical protein